MQPSNWYYSNHRVWLGTALKILYFKNYKCFFSTGHEDSKVSAIPICYPSKFVGTRPSYKKRIYQATVSQRLRNGGLNDMWLSSFKIIHLACMPFEFETHGPYTLHHFV